MYFRIANIYINSIPPRIICTFFRASVRIRHFYANIYAICGIIARDTLPAPEKSAIPHDKQGLNERQVRAPGSPENRHARLRFTGSAHTEQRTAHSPVRARKPYYGKPSRTEKGKANKTE